MRELFYSPKHFLHLNNPVVVDRSVCAPDMTHSRLKDPALLFLQACFPLCKKQSCVLMHVILGWFNNVKLEFTFPITRAPKGWHRVSALLLVVGWSGRTVLAISK